MESTIIQGICNHGKRIGLLLGKHSPEIMLVAGSASVIAGAVMACKATLKVDDILVETETKNDKINLALEDETISYSEEDARKDRIVLGAQTAMAFARLYAPAIGLGVLGFGLIFGGHHILNRRNAAIAAAYKVVDKTFKEYRERVVDRFGEGVDNEIRYDSHEEEIELEEENEDGSIKKEKTYVQVVAPWENSMYARVFDKEHTPKAQSDRSHNLMILQTEQNWFSDLLKSRGHVFLNEVYDALGYDHTPEGAVVGWVYDADEPIGDNYVDFCISSEIYNIDEKGNAEDKIIIDFNVDGVIWDLI